MYKNSFKRKASTHYNKIYNQPNIIINNSSLNEQQNKQQEQINTTTSSNIKIISTFDIIKSNIQPDQTQDVIIQQPHLIQQEQIIQSSPSIQSQTQQTQQLQQTDEQLKEQNKPQQIPQQIQQQIINNQIKPYKNPEMIENPLTSINSYTEPSKVNLNNNQYQLQQIQEITTKFNDDIKNLEKNVRILTLYMDQVKNKLGTQEQDIKNLQTTIYL